jgi:hypothetical protein
MPIAVIGATGPTERTMNTRTSSHLHDGRAWGLASGAKAGIAILFIVAGLDLGACHDGAPAVINKAVAAPEASTFYFPAQFALPEGLPEPTLELY